jgi:cytochrome c-type biogenesis protein CcmF
MAILGSLMLLLALSLSAYSLVIGALAQRQLFTGARGRVSPERLAQTASLSGMISFIAVSVAVIALLRAIFANDFSLAYVLHESSRELPGAYKLAALWSGQEGSLLLWAWLLTGFGCIVRMHRKPDLRMASLASTIIAGVEVFFLLLLNFVALPFAVVAGAIPTDGYGMNPLLQYPEMIIHPPLLYLGYVGFTVPFAFVLAALMMRAPADRWIALTRRWSIVVWLFLTCGIVLGMHWAYAVLGWGGYWGWDPVENASLMPWLTGTAFLHSMILYEKRGMLKKWSIWLIFSTFLLCTLGTMLTRSGIVSSVHAFGKSPLGVWFWGFLLLVLTVSALSVALRRDFLRTDRKIDAVVSREAAFLFINLVLLTTCIVVFMGTLLPVFSQLMRGEQLTVGPAFYNRVIAPIGVFLLLLTSTAPLQSGRWSRKSLLRDFAGPLIAGAVVMAVLIAGGIHPWRNRGVFYSWVCISIAAVVAVAVAQALLRGVFLARHQTGKSLFSAALFHARWNPRRYGAYMVHFGIALMFIGFAGSSFNRSIEAELSPGQRMEIGPYRLSLRGVSDASTDAYVAERSLIDVRRAGNKPFELSPEARLYQTSQTRETMVANHSTPLWDLYVVYEGNDQTNALPVIDAILNPLVMWIWIGASIVAAGAAIVALEPVLANPRRPGLLPASTSVR